MQKDYTLEVYEEFLKSLRVALTNTAVYFPEHPLYLKAVDDFKKSTEKTFTVLNPITMGIAAHSLIFTGKYLADSQLTRSIAEFFHVRKIKSITFLDKVSSSDLNTFLAFVNLSAREITIHGGLSHMLEQKDITQITVSDLSYSELLAGDGVEYKDLWLYLLREGLQQNNVQQLQALANNFHKALRRLKLKEIINDNEIGTLIENFFEYLKKVDAQRLSKCARDLAKSTFDAKGIEPTASLDIVKKLLGHLTPDDLARVFLMQLQSNERIDAMSFGLFARIISDEKHIKVATSLAQELLANKQALEDPQVILKLRELFSLPDDNPVLKTYHQQLHSLFRGLQLGEGLSFDEAQLESNYRALLLDLFIFDDEPNSFFEVTDHLLEALENAIRQTNTGFIKNFSEVYVQKMEHIADNEQLSVSVRKKVSAFAEKLIFEDGITIKGWLSGLVTVPAHKREYYLDKIFKEEKVSQISLELFFKFFAADIDEFYAYLGPYMENIAFLKKIMAGLEKVRSKLSADILKYIYSVSNSYVKLEVLKQMRVLSISDKDFLFSILSGRDSFQRKEALAIIAKTPALRKEAAVLLLSVTNPFGIRSRIILENLELVGYSPFDEMRDYLVALSNYRFFWNRAIRETAKKILMQFSQNAAP